MSKPLLVGSAPTLETLLKCAQQYFHNDKVTFKSVEEGKTWLVEHDSGQIEGFRVKLQRGRYRLECSPD